MFSPTSFSQATTLVRTRMNAILAVLVIVCIGLVVASLTKISWYLGISVIAFIVVLGIAGQLVLFVLAYKGYERWSKRRTGRIMPSFGTIMRIVINGYIRSLWCFLAIAVVVSLFNPSLPVLLRIFAWVFTGINIFVTFLSAHPRDWDKNTGVPSILGIGFGIQVLFLFLLKLL